MFANEKSNTPNFPIPVGAYRRGAHCIIGEAQRPSYLSEDAKVELLCENALMGSIIDRLGEDISVQIVDKEHFKVTATMALSNTFYGWGFASGGKMRIFGPEKVREQFQAIPDNFSV